jgi:hypothetical protein
MSLMMELMGLVERLPESKIPDAVRLLSQLIEEKPLEGPPIEGKITPEQPVERQQCGADIPDPLAAFLATIVHSITNTMYDLSVEAKRKDEKVMANRLETYRKKVSEGWETYKGKQGLK